MASKTWQKTENYQIIHCEEYMVHLWSTSDSLFVYSLLTFYRWNSEALSIALPNAMLYDDKEATN